MGLFWDSSPLLGSCLSNFVCEILTSLTFTSFHLQKNGGTELRKGYTLEAKRSSRFEVKTNNSPRNWAIQSTIIIIIIIEICMDVCMYQTYSSIDPQLQSKSGLGLPHSMTISDIRQIMAF